jgi:hypothetical protein
MNIKIEDFHSKHFVGGHIMIDILKLVTFMTVFSVFALTATPSWTASDTADELIQATYEPFSDMLNKYLIEKPLVDGGLVTAFDYRKALENQQIRSLIDDQNRHLEDFDIIKLTSRELALAFWNNAYNFFMLSHILENPQRGNLVSSVRDYGNFLNPYRVFGQKIFNIGGRKYSLDEIEKDILLGDAFKQKGWKEARIHFIVNCASVGCPPLRKQIYLPGNIDRMMSENTRKSLNTDRHLRLEGDILYVTRLFDWYQSDFVDEEGSIEAFIKKYADPAVQANVAAADDI